jgi:hypothetical protein
MSIYEKTIRCLDVIGAGKPLGNARPSIGCQRLTYRLQPLHPAHIAHRRFAKMYCCSAAWLQRMINLLHFDHLTSFTLPTFISEGNLGNDKA